MISGSNKPSKLANDIEPAIKAGYLGSLDDNELENLIQKLYLGEIDPTALLSGLIEETESMKEDEKKHWIVILPVMKKNHIERLIKILTEEARKLMVLEKKYRHEIKTLNDKA